ncbi:MAG: hypothetical protein QM765_48120 [Myxococcales bacterium]
MPSATALAAPLAAAIVAAAPGPALPKCEKFGDSWREYRTSHFVLDTDAGKTKALALVTELERMRALIIQAVLGGPAEVPGTLRVLAPNDPALFTQLSGRRDQVVGYFLLSYLQEPTVVVQTVGLEVDPELIAHELVHHLSWHMFPRQPRWFTEGLAMFMQSVGRERSDVESSTGSHLSHSGATGGHWAGVQPRYALDVLKVAGKVDVKALLSWKGVTDDDIPERYHLWSWLLFHYLWNQESKRFTALQERLSRAEDPAQAWLAVFPEYNPNDAAAAARLSEALEQHRLHSKGLTYKVEAKVEPQVTEAPLPAADVHVLTLAVRRVRPLSVAVAELEESLREDPLQPQAIGWLSTLTDTSPLEALRNAVAARPTDARAWLELASHTTEPIEKEKAVRQALALEPANPTCLNNLAWLLVTTGRAREALKHANRAVGLEPWSAATIDTLAVVARELGKCPEALVLQRRAVALSLSDGGETIRKHLEELEARSKTAPNSSAPLPSAAPAGKAP